MRVLFILFSVISVVNALKLFANRFIPTSKSFVTSLQAVPLELTGQLDTTKSWDVKFIFNGEEKVCMYMYPSFVVYFDRDNSNNLYDSTILII